MGNRASSAESEFYHLYNRGTEKRKIFLNRSDYERFLALLYLANSEEPVRTENIRRTEQGPTLLKQVMELPPQKPLISITAYCLMPNHFHLLVREENEAGISRFMQKLSTAYTMYFNKKYERSGTLFQGKYKSRHADNDRYLKYLLAYIHLNPSKIASPATYEYSSYADFTGEERPQGSILNRDALPLYFESARDFKREMREWLSYQDEIAER
jgi:putative transposase